MADPPSVFISYSHKDTDWKDLFVRHLNVSVKQGHFVEWNDKKIGAGEDWYEKITAAMDAASVGAFLISADFLGSDFILREEVTRLIERREREGLPIVPVYLRSCDWEAVDWLRRMQMRPGGVPVVRGLDHVIDDEFALIAKEIRLLVEGAAKAPPAERGQAGLIKPPDLTRLPRVGEHLFGRERELALLDGAWADEQTNVISLIAWGGVGKTALVKHWLGRMARDQFRGARRVYGWSFYKQSLREEEASADEFFADALRWFDVPQPDRFQQTERARRLAEVIQKERTLLILDGLEPLQHSAKTNPEGQIRDQTLAELVRLLAWHNPGLLVITSRYIVDDIRDQRATTAPVIELGDLSPPAGAQLLRTLGVEGEQEELEAASREFGGHSLALNLLGAYLRDMLDGDVRRRGEVSLLAEDVERGGHARRIMRSYERQFGDSPELDVLHLIGLFDRPAKRELLRVLRRRPVIEGLNDKLVDLGALQWKRILARLKHANLLSETSPDDADAHPLVREHFGARLRKERPEAWRAGHGRLYEHLRDSSKTLPDILAEMAPLIQAMHHGCQAGRHQEALDEAYRKRICRPYEFVIIKRLGAHGADLTALGGLFDLRWSAPVTCIHDEARGFVLNQVALDLRSLGRLREAETPLRAALEIAIAREDWRNAIQGASNLSELSLALGDLAEAVTVAETGMSHADRLRETFVLARLTTGVLRFAPLEGAWLSHVGMRTTLAEALHQMGNKARATALFEEAEQFQAMFQQEHPHLYAIPGFRYCELLLDVDRPAEVRNRARYSITVAQSSNLLLDIALDHLSLGRAALALGEPDEAIAQLDQAVDGLRKAGQIQELPRGLLARAALFPETGDFKRAKQDLEEAMRIAGRSEMQLFQCDAHLEFARLALAEGDKETARAHLAEAKRLVEATGYGRRRPEVAELGAVVR